MDGTYFEISTVGAGNVVPPSALCSSKETDMKNVKIIVEKHEDGYVAYPLGLKGVVVGQGESYEEALTDVRSAIKFHVETFGSDVLITEPPVLEAFVAETGVPV